MGVVIWVSPSYMAHSASGIGQQEKYLPSPYIDRTRSNEYTQTKKDWLYKSLLPNGFVK